MQGCDPEIGQRLAAAASTPEEEEARCEHRASCPACAARAAPYETKTLDGLPPGQDGAPPALPLPPPASAPTSPLPARGEGVGRFLVLEPLGEGGMGAVFAAWDPRLARRIALKLLSGPRASAVQNPSSSAGNSNLPWLSVRPVNAGLFGFPGAKTRTSASASGFPSAVANSTET